MGAQAEEQIVGLALRQPAKHRGSFIIRELCPLSQSRHVVGGHSFRVDGSNQAAPGVSGTRRTA